MVDQVLAAHARRDGIHRPQGRPPGQVGAEQDGVCDQEACKLSSGVVTEKLGVSGQGYNSKQE